MSWRRAVRAIMLCEDDSVLLCRFHIAHPAVPFTASGLWAAPGGGVESGESALQALRRELLEETGFVLNTEPPHIWHQQIAGLARDEGYEGVINDYFLVRTDRFDPRGALSDDELAAENISGMRWWRLDEIADYRGSDLFSPRDLAIPLAAVIAGDIASSPVILGL